MLYRNVLLLFISLFLLFTGLLSVNSQAANTYIPPKAFQYFPIINNELNRIFPELTLKHYIPSLIEHESCITLKHKRCWEPTSELLSSREQGVGLGQLTRAYRPDGTVRFDTLKEMRSRYMTELKELSWSNIKQKPDLQIRTIILMTKTNYNNLYTIKGTTNRLIFSNVSYNGGLAGVNKERIACGLAEDCNPQYWFGNVEKYCLKSKKPLYGTRSACDINREHTRSIFVDKMPKYKPYFQ